MNNQEQTTNNININDLTVTDDQQSRIKGGPTPIMKRDVILKTSVAEQDSVLGDLEPAGDVTGGAPNNTCGTWRCGFNHNETVVNDTNDEDEAQTAKLADLPVTEEQAEETK
ncbi:MAG: hypothetical protein ACREA2_08775, partial [Blastocatellia bacterium]